MSSSIKDSAPKSGPRLTNTAHGTARPATSTPTERALRVDSISAETGRAYVTVSGMLGRAGAELVASILQTQFRRGNAYVRLDLHGLTGLGKAGVDVLARAHKFFLANRGTLVLAEVTPSTQAELTRLDPDGGLLVLGPSADRGESVSEGFAG